VSTRSQLHHDMECKSEGESSDDSVGHLSFCDVEIKGLRGSVRALDDSGTRLSLVNPKVINPLNLARFGKVVVRVALGDPVCAPLVNLQL